MSRVVIELAQIARPVRPEQAISYRAIASQCEPSAAQGNHESVDFWIGRALESYRPE